MNRYASTCLYIYRERELVAQPYTDMQVYKFACKQVCSMYACRCVRLCVLKRFYCRFWPYMRLVVGQV